LILAVKEGGFFQVQPEKSGCHNFFNFSKIGIFGFFAAAVGGGIVCL
jgi:hypothetical protein